MWRSDDGGETLTPVIAAPREETSTAVVTTQTIGFLSYLVPRPDDTVLMSYTRCEVTKAQGRSVRRCLPYFTESTDRGETWSEPAPMAEPQNSMLIPGLVHATIDVGKDGTIYSAFFDAKHVFANSGPLLLSKSTDGGESFETSIISADVHFPLRVRVAADPNTDNVYVAWQTNDSGDPATNAMEVSPTFFDTTQTIRFTRSTDAGASWEDPRTLNSDPPEDGRDHYLPVLDVAPNGRLDAWWYDSRFSSNDDPDDPFYNAEVNAVYTWSEDGGATFAPEVRVSDVSTDQSGETVQFFHYMTSRDEGAYIAWTDKRESTVEQPDVNDTYFAKVLHSGG